VEQTVNDNKLSAKERSQQFIKALLCALAAILVLIYGMILATNLITQLNPVNTGIVYTTAVVCYGGVGLVFVGLWHQVSKALTRGFSGLKD
jgi:uncharacterized membrane-anchored protein